MKKLLLGLIASVALSANAGTIIHETQRMLTGTYLVLSNSSTTAIYSSTSTNIPYYSYAAGTNVFSYNTNAAGFLYPGPIVQGNLFSDLNGDVNPNCAIQIVLGYTNNLFTSGVQSPVMLNTVWTNPSPLVINVVGTNSIAVTVYPIGGMNLLDTGSSAQSKIFTFSFGTTNYAGNGLPIVITTNLPTAFLQGCEGLGATITMTAVSGATNTVVLNALNVVSWRP